METIVLQGFVDLDENETMTLDGGYVTTEICSAIVSSVGGVVVSAGITTAAKKIGGVIGTVFGGPIGATVGIVAGGLIGNALADVLIK